jgi:hypothetical protein
MSQFLGSELESLTLKKFKRLPMSRPNYSSRKRTELSLVLS